METNNLFRRTNAKSTDNKTDCPIEMNITNEPLVSSDIEKSPFASTVDLEMTRNVNGDFVKIMTRYDNE